MTIKKLSDSAKLTPPPPVDSPSTNVQSQSDDDNEEILHTNRSRSCSSRTSSLENSQRFELKKTEFYDKH